MSCVRPSQLGMRGKSETVRVLPVLHCQCSALTFSDDQAECAHGLRRPEIKQNKNKRTYCRPKTMSAGFVAKTRPLQAECKWRTTSAKSSWKGERKTNITANVTRAPREIQYFGPERRIAEFSMLRECHNAGLMMNR